MHSLDRTAFGGLACYLASAALLTAAGCSSGTSVKSPDVDPQAAAKIAMERYDANTDSSLEPAELAASCPALAAALVSFDADGSGRLSADEIAQGLTQMYGPGMSLTEVNCYVTVQGRPLAGAKVRFRPIEMLGDTLPQAEGVTDKRGIAHPTIGAELLPDEFRERALLFPGLYHVEITHPQTQLASRFNASTKLGCMIDPAARGGTSVRFDVSTK
jgi:hypothetical protein